MKTYIQKIIDKFILAEKSPRMLALSFSLGTFIAFAPIIPLQTPLALVLSKAFRLNPTVCVTTLYLVNNPFTLVPIYILDYVVGSWLLVSLLGLPVEAYNPSWIDRFSRYLSKYIDIGKHLGTQTLCFWCLLIGGLLVAGVAALLVYPFVYKFFQYVIAQREKLAYKELKESAATDKSV